MTATTTRTAAFIIACCLSLAGCATAKPVAGPNPAVTAVSRAGDPAAPTTAAAGTGGGSVDAACELVTEQDARTAIGSATGPGTAGGTAASSECIYGGGALIVGMKRDSKAFYEKSHTDGATRGATDVSGIGDGAFEAGTDHYSTLLFLTGTTVVSIIFSGAGAQGVAVALAKVAASRM